MKDIKCVIFDFDDTIIFSETMKRNQFYEISKIYGYIGVDFYNNNVNKESKNLIRNTNNRLRKNYKILTELNVSGKTKATRRKLFDRGFDFRLFTSIYTTKTGNIYFYVYNQGYLELDNELYLLVKQD